MPTRRLLSAAGLLTLCLSAPPAGAEADVAFVSPRDGELLSGETRFSFRVRPGADVARIDVYVGGTLAGSALPPEWSFRWTTPATLVATAILAIALDASGDPLERVRIRTAETVVEQTIDVNAVQLYPVVIDRGGRYVRGLSRESFTVLDQGRPVEIEYFSDHLDDLTLAIVLDSSRSMTGNMSFVIAAACRLIEQLHAGDRVSVYAFNHGLLAGPSGAIGSTAPAGEPSAGDADPAQDEPDSDAVRGELETFVRGLIADGGTALYDALAGVVGDLAPTAGRKAVILFSDGEDKQSLLNLAQVVSRARESEAIVYTVGTGGAAKDERARQDLETLARETGGQAFFFDSYRKLDAVFESVLLDLHSQYALSYTPTEGESGMRPIEVKVDGPGYRVRCRPSYFYEKSR